MQVEHLERIIDYTLLNIAADERKMSTFFDSALQYNFITVAILPTMVPLARERLSGTDIGITTAIGFPTGSLPTSVKLFEIEDHIRMGATELDMVVNIPDVKLERFDRVQQELKQAREACADHVLKVILQTTLLTREEIIRLCGYATEYEVDFVKTTTGFDGNVADEESVRLMSESTGGRTKVKAAGGIRDLDRVLAMIEAGAERIGLSRGPEVMEEFYARSGKDR
jgi:deoxyribose-phosphate aldolase